MKKSLFTLMGLIASVPALAVDPFFPAAASSEVPYTAVGVSLSTEVPPFNPNSESYSVKVLVVAGLNRCDADSSVKSLVSQEDPQGGRSVLSVDISGVQSFACTEVFSPVYQELEGFVVRWKNQPIVLSTNTRNFGDIKMLKNEDSVVTASDSLRFSGVKQLAGEEGVWRIANFEVAAFAGNNDCEARNTSLKAYSYLVDGVLRVGVEQQMSPSLAVCPSVFSPVLKTIKFVAAFPVGGVKQIVVENVGEMGRTQEYGVPEQMK